MQAIALHVEVPAPVAASCPEPVQDRHALGAMDTTYTPQGRPLPLPGEAQP